MKPLFAAYLVAIHAALGLLVVRPDVVPKVMARAGFGEPEMEKAAQRAARFKLQQRMDASVPPGATVFLGDSITEGLTVAAVAPRGVNYGISGLSAQELEGHVRAFASLARASTIYLSIGINDLRRGHESSLPSSLKAISAALPAGVPVVWSGIMPVAGKVESISSMNKQIEALCAARPACVFVDTTKAMGDDRGLPLDGIYIDGLHPNARGYELWIGALGRAGRTVAEAKPTAG